MHMSIYLQCFAIWTMNTDAYSYLCALKDYAIYIYFNEFAFTIFLLSFLFLLPFARSFACFVDGFGFIGMKKICSDCNL